MGRFKRLGINTGLVFIGTAGSKLITLLMLPLYTRWLNVDQYGAVDLVTTYSGLFLGIVSMSIFDSVFIFPKGQEKNTQEKYLSSSIIFALITSIITIIICFGIRELSIKYLWHGFLIDYIWQITLLLLTSYIQQIFQQFNRAIDKMNVFAFTGLIQTIGMVAFSFYLIPRYKINGYVGALIIGNIIGTVYSIFAGGGYKYFSIKSWSRPALLEMLKYSIPIIPNGIMWFFVNSINRPILENYHGLFAVGLIAIANKIPTIVNQIYIIFQNAFTISALEESETPTYQQFYNQTLKAVFIFQIIMVSVTTICSKWIIELFTSVEYFISWRYVPLLVLGVLFTNISTFVGTNFTISRKSKYYFYSTVWAAATALLLNFILIPKFSIWGACIALLFSQIVGLAVRIKYSYKIVQITSWSFYMYNLLLTIVVVATSIITLEWYLQYPIFLAIMIVFIFVNRFYLINFSSLIRRQIHKFN